MTTSEMYRLLELKEGATAEEVKKAYFRLIRKYPPETHPEDFQRLRAAYEALKDGPPKNEGRITIETHTQLAEYLVESAMDYADAGDYEGACSVLEDALNMEPKNPSIHSLMARYQIYEDHPQVAARHAQIVTELQPDDLEAWIILANALDNRGWYKKARNAFQRAYELGARDPDFLVARIDNMIENEGEDAVSAEEFIEVIRATPVTPQYHKVIWTAYSHWATRVSPDPKSVSDLLTDYERYMGRVSDTSRPEHEYLIPMLALLSENSAVLMNLQNRKRMYKTVQKLVDRHQITQKTADEFSGEVIVELVGTDMRLEQTAWLGMCMYALEYVDPELMSCHVADCQLALLENMEQTMQEAEIIRSEYPELPEHYPEFFTALETGTTDAFVRELSPRTRKLTRKYKGYVLGRQLAELTALKVRNHETDLDDLDDLDDPDPDEVDAFYRENAADEDENDDPDGEFWVPEDPYVRDKPTVGRNDPCPCGSGKKFKKCCMGKGIYD